MNNNTDDLKHIRSMMERSSKFLSISGFAGISAGACALLGTLVVKLILDQKLSFTGDTVCDIFLTAGVVFCAAAFCGLYFSMKKAKKSNSKFWMPITIQILKDFSVPLLAGGVLCFIMLVQSNTQYIVPAMLIFYGLALISAGARTYRDIKILGACEITLGFLAAIVPQYSLLIWSIGFGVLHIVYGVVIHWKYDREAKKTAE